MYYTLYSVHVKGETFLFLKRIFFSFKFKRNKIYCYTINSQNDFINILPACIINQEFALNDSNSALYKYLKSPINAIDRFE